MRLNINTLARGTTPLARGLRWALIALVVYALAGFLVVPAVAKWQLARTLTRTLSREVAIEQLAINPFALTVRVRGFSVKEPSGGELAVGFEELYLNLSATSLIRFAPVLDEVRLLRPSVRIVRNTDKSYNYTDLIHTFTADQEPAAHESGPPRFSLNNIEIIDGRVEFDDRPEHARHVASEIHIGIPFLSSLPYATDVNVLPAFSAKVNGAPIALKGETKPFKETRETTLRLDLQGLDLPRYADYSPVPLGFRVQRGTLDAELALSLTTRDNLLDTLVISGKAALNAVRLADAAGAPLAGVEVLQSAARFSLTRRGRATEMIVSDGKAALRGLRVEDAAHGAPLIEVGEVTVAGAGADLGAGTATIGDVRIDSVNVSLVRNPDGGFNFDRLIGGNGAAPSPPAASGEDSRAPSTLQIKNVTVARVRADFRDYTVKPNVSLRFKNVAGTVSEITTDSAGDVTFNGVMGGGSFNITGRVNPFAPDLLLDLRMNLHGIEMVTFSPYAATYGGYGIDKGKLSIRTTYLVERRTLAAENHVYIDQLTFGEKVESPAATKLPVRLAAALLTDRRGVIDLDLPVSGSLDDPTFRLGGAILRVFINLIAKAATSPFALLGAAFGGGGELASVDFLPGRSTITPEAEARLKALARGLIDHPALRMEIAGRVDPGVDLDGLKRYRIEQKVKAQKLKSKGRSASGGTLDHVVVTPQEYPRYLTAAYKAEKFKRARNIIGMVKTLPVPEMERLMFESATATDDDLLVLADDRAGAVKEWLMEKGEIAPERLFLTAPRLSKKETERAARAEFVLQ